MTGSKSPRPERPDPESSGFDFTSPRWREQTAAEAEPGRQRRDENRPAPEQRGSIDAGDSVPSGDMEDSR